MSGPDTFNGGYSMRKSFVVLVLLLIPASLFAQDWRNRRAPRDRYGYGSLENKLELTPFVGYTWGGTIYGDQYLKWPFSQDFWNYSPYLAQCAQSMQPHSPFNETHTSNPKLVSLYKSANKTPDQDKRKQYVQDMMNFDFNNGGYIIPAFISALDAYSTKLAGYTPARVGQPLDDFNFEDFYFA